MNPETLAFHMYLRNRICLRELMMLSETLILQMYLAARINLQEFKILMGWMEAKAKSKKRVRKRAKTDDKQASSAQ